MDRHLCAVDVGTGSARVGVFDARGRLLATADHPILIERPAPDHVEHDGEDVWSAVCTATRSAVERAGIAPESVAAIAFDATCSLVARDAEGRPVSISTTGQNRWDTIVWLDHRAMAEAEICTATGHPLVALSGGAVSPEMQAPKLLWLKRHLPQAWARIHHLFDLADFLAWKACGSTARSRCTLTTKWTHRPEAAEGWSADFFAAIGLDDLIERAGLPERTAPPGSDLGPLGETAAGDLGLTTACRVGAGVVDAYAGGLALLGPHGGDPAELERRAALIAGTSSCVMTCTRAPIAFAGGWGPYHGVTLPGLWTTEGGQSASGALLDHVIRWHGAGGEPTADRHAQVIRRVEELRAAQGEAFAERLHVLPDFHGNRAPLADPHALGVVSGLAIDTSFDGLAALYWRTAVALALGIRHILDALAEAGQRIDILHLTGGHARNPLLVELYADVTGCRLVMTDEENAMLRGTAMLAATAVGLHPDLVAAAAAMTAPTFVRDPDPRAKRRWDVDYRVFRAMQAHRHEIDRLIAARAAAAPLDGKRLVVFDCDGVLVDSEPIALDVLRLHLEEHGATVDPARLAAEALGRSAREVYAGFRDGYGVDIDEAAAERIQDRLFARFRAELVAMPGIHDLLDRLEAAGIAYCLASSSSPPRLAVALAATGLAERFARRVFSAAMVAHGKPAPDLFLHAARVMGVAPDDCLVVEDSPTGIEAAHRAGMTVVGFLGGGHAAGADFRARIAAARPELVCTDLGELVRLVDRPTSGSPGSHPPPLAEQ